MKGWRSGRIDSNFFDNPIAYRNPTRDPAPSATFWSEAPLHIFDAQKGRTFAVDARDVEAALGPWVRRHLFRDDVDNLAGGALAEGFAEADHRHVYSRVPKDGILTGLAKLAGAYLVDGVVGKVKYNIASGRLTFKGQTLGGSHQRELARQCQKVLKGR